MAEQVRIGFAPPINQFKIATLVPSRCTKSPLEYASKARGFQVSLGNYHQRTQAYHALLRTRSERPSDDRAAEKCDELASPHMPPQAKDHAKIHLKGSTFRRC